MTPSLRLSLPLLTLLLPLAVALPGGPAQAQGCDGDCPPPPPVYPEVFNEPAFVPDLTVPGGGTLVAAVASRDDTARITARLSDSFEFCTAIQRREYVVDCLSERLDSLAAELPATGDYAEMRQVLSDAAQRLDAIVDRNPSLDLPAGVATRTGPAPVATSRPLRPVATEAAEAVIAEAATVIEEAQTVLLRSSQGSADRSLAYQEVAAELETGTVLLRST